MKKIIFMRRLGYALIAISLVFLTLLNSTSEFRFPVITFYAYIILIVGFALFFLSKIFEFIQRSRLKKNQFYCLGCGWCGSGGEWFRYRCCPECDSEDVDQL